MTERGAVTGETVTESMAEGRRTEETTEVTGTSARRDRSVRQQGRTAEHLKSWLRNLVPTDLIRRTGTGIRSMINSPSWKEAAERR